MAGIVKSVEKVQVTLTAALEPVTVNLSRGQDETQCVPFHTARWGDDPGTDMNSELYYEVQIIDNSGTAAVKVLSSDRLETSSQIIEVFVVEFDEAINVQAVAVSTLDDTVGLVRVTVADVGSQTSAFMIYSPQNISGRADDDFDNVQIYVQWEDAATDSVELTRWSTGKTGDMNGTLYVVDCDAGEFTVEHAVISRSASAGVEATTTITEVVAANTFLIHSCGDYQAGDDLNDSCWHADLEDTTTVRVRRASTTAGTTASQHRIAVVECQNSEWSVQREGALVLDSASVTDTITEIDQAKAIIIGGHIQGGLAMPRSDNSDGSGKTKQAFALDFSSDTAIRAQRLQGTDDDDIIAYEVVEFELTDIGTGTAYTNFNATNYLQRWDDVYETRPLLVSAWVYFDTALPGASETIFSQGALAASAHRRSLYLDGSTGKYGVYEVAGSGGSSAALTGVGTADQWQHIFGEFLTTTSRVANLDGVRGDESTNTIDQDAATAIRIGNGVQDSAPFTTDNAIASVSLWDGAGMSEADRDGLRDKLAAGQYPDEIDAEGGQPWSGDLQAYWTLAPVDASDGLLDVSGNGHHLSRIGPLTGWQGVAPPLGVTITIPIYHHHYSRNLQ